MQNKMFSPFFPEHNCPLFWISFFWTDQVFFFPMRFITCIYQLQILPAITFYHVSALTTPWFSVSSEVLLVCLIISVALEVFLCFNGPSSSCLDCALQFWINSASQHLSILIPILKMTTFPLASVIQDYVA